MSKRTMYMGPHEIILGALQGKLVDLEGCQGLRTDQEGFSGVVDELGREMAGKGAAAGVPQDVYDDFVMCNATVAMIDQHIEAVHKLAEVLRESRAFYVDARNNDISLMVDAMRSRAQRRKDESVLLPFEKTLRYNSQIADKAAKTRQKNAEAAAQAEAEAAAEAEGEAEAPTG
ncbi:MAG TPA: hypothetical protein VLS89_09045 [Candidatus Nanopelagicales bacterium]|nr:hypothetical protein [Candidatus Nanopelagicales bacterium]